MNNYGFSIFNRRASGGDIFGSLIGQNISMGGTGSAHYDETLSSFLTTPEPFRIIEW